MLGKCHNMLHKIQLHTPSQYIHFQSLQKSDFACDILYIQTAHDIPDFKIILLLSVTLQKDYKRIDTYFWAYSLDVHIKRNNNGKHENISVCYETILTETTWTQDIIMKKDTLVNHDTYICTSIAQWSILPKDPTEWYT